MPKITVITSSIRPQFLNITQEALEKQTFQDFEWLVEIGLRNRPGWGLPRDDNKALKRAQGERIVFLQDCITIEPDTLEKIHALPNEMYTFPVGQVMSFDQTPEWDWRPDNEGIVDPHMWEQDFACGPKQAFFDVGGYDETFDQGWAWNNVEIAWRIAATGRQFWCNASIRGISLKHDQIVENPFRNKLENNDKRADETRKKAARKEFKLNYLD